MCGGVWRVSFRIRVSVVFEWLDGCLFVVCVGGLVDSFLVCVLCCWLVSVLLEGG